MNRERNTICCIAHYTTDSTKSERRRENMSVMPIIDYIAEKLNENGYSMKIISPTETLESHGIYKERVDATRNGIEICSCATIGGKNTIKKIINRLLIAVSLLRCIARYTNKGDTIIVYHDPSNATALLFAKKIFKLRFVLYFGEVYQHVYPSMRKRVKKNEWKLIRRSDAYILATDNLRQYTHSKPNVVLNGIYKAEKRFSQERFADDGKINLLYGGKISAMMGAFKAVELSKYLDKQYCIRIIGSGEHQEEEKLKQLIKESRDKSNGAEVVFDGKKDGDDYIRYVQSCQIGLSIRDITGEFNQTSFPSKVCSYLCNGLAVVSTPIPTVVNSRLSDCINFSKDMSAESIACAITESIHSFDAEYVQNKISTLDIAFSKNLYQLIELLKQKG